MENKLNNLTAYLNEQEKKKDNTVEVMDIFQAYEADQKATTKPVKASKKR